MKGEEEGSMTIAVPTEIKIYILVWIKRVGRIEGWHEEEDEGWHGEEDEGWRGEEDEG